MQLIVWNLKNTKNKTKKTANDWQNLKAKKRFESQKLLVVWNEPTATFFPYNLKVLSIYLM